MSYITLFLMTEKLNPWFQFFKGCYVTKGLIFHVTADGDNKNITQQEIFWEWSRWGSEKGMQRAKTLWGIWALHFQKRIELLTVPNTLTRHSQTTVVLVFWSKLSLGASYSSWEQVMNVLMASFKEKILYKI